MNEVLDCHPTILYPEISAEKKLLNWGIRIRVREWMNMLAAILWFLYWQLSFHECKASIIGKRVSEIIALTLTLASRWKTSFFFVFCFFAMLQRHRHIATIKHFFFQMQKKNVATEVINYQLLHFTFDFASSSMCQFNNGIPRVLLSDLIRVEMRISWKKSTTIHFLVEIYYKNLKLIIYSRPDHLGQLNLAGTQWGWNTISKWMVFLRAYQRLYDVITSYWYVA